MHYQLRMLQSHSGLTCFTSEVFACGYRIGLCLVLSSCGGSRHEGSQNILCSDDVQPGWVDPFMLFSDEVIIVGVYRLFKKMCLEKL